MPLPVTEAHMDRWVQSGGRSCIGYTNIEFCHGGDPVIGVYGYSIQKYQIQKYYLSPSPHEQSRIVSIKAAQQQNQSPK